jgi:hypothetical protein
MKRSEAPSKPKKGSRQGKNKKRRGVRLTFYEDGGTYFGQFVRGDLAIRTDVSFKVREDGTIREVELGDFLLLRLDSETIERALVQCEALIDELQHLIEAEKSGDVSVRCDEGEIRWYLTLKLKNPVRFGKGCEGELMESIIESFEALPESVKDLFALDLELW